ncbi:MAG: SurA N-terminal domain-containing protein [Candidatus Omnitrophica bacterium]|nr:SurA N-terminal domain-containing protein [Candidatus Omnitrophota bacterium]
MPKFLRKQKFVKKVFYVLAIIIIPSFIFWGSASVIKDKRTKGYAGKIFGKKVSYEEYMSALYAWRNQLKIKFGDQAHQIENLFDPNQAVWDKLILRYEAKKMKIRVSNDELTEYVTSLPFLQKDGIFNSGLYELFLKYSLNTPPRIFEEQIRESLKFQKIFDYVTEDVQISESQIKDRYKQEHEQIKVRYISLLSKDLETEIKLNEQEQIDYYQKQKDDFRIPIQINLNYMGIDYLKDATDEQKEGIDDKIKELHEFLNEGSDLPTAKEKFGLRIKETGFFSLGELVPGFDLLSQNVIELFNLKQNQIADIIQTPRGPYIFQLKEKRVDFLPEFEEVKQKVKHKLTKEKSKQLAKTRMDGYYSQIKSEKESNPDFDFVNIAKKLRLSVEETDFFSKNSYAPEIGYSKEFNDIAFNLSEGEISQVIELEQGYFVIEIAEFKPIDEEEFQKEKENLKKTLLEEKKNQAFEEYFAKLKAKANLIDYVSIQKNQQSPAQPN